MTTPTNTVTTYSAIGNREDLASIIYDISPMDTPFLSQAAKSRASAVYHECQTDALDAAGANRQIEGDDATANTFVATTRVGNYCQISSKTISVSGTQRAVNPAGRADELSYQLAKRGREIKRDMEFALTRSQGSSAGGTGTARSLASLESWLAMRLDLAGMGRCGLVGQGAVWYDGVRQVRWGEIKSGGASYGLVWSGRHGSVRCGSVRFGGAVLGTAGVVGSVRYG